MVHHKLLWIKQNEKWLLVSKCPRTDWPTHLPVQIHWVSCFSGGWGKVSLAFSALIIRWHFTQHSVWIKALLSALLQLHICFPPGLFSAFLCASLALLLHLSAICCHQLTLSPILFYVSVIDWMNPAMRDMELLNLHFALPWLPWLLLREKAHILEWLYFFHMRP